MSGSIKLKNIMTAKDWILLVISILSFLGFGTFFSFLWNRSIKKHQQDSEMMKQYIEKQQKEELDQVIKSDLRPIEEAIKQLQQDRKDEKKALTATLKNDLLKSFYDCDGKGYKTLWDAQNFNAMYEAYLKLGGNSFIKNDIAPKFNALPERTDNDKKGGKR